MIYYLQMVEQHSPEWRDVQAIVDGSRQDDEFVAGVLESIRASGAVEQAVDRANDYIEQAKRVASMSFPMLKPATSSSSSPSRPSAASPSSDSSA